MKLSSQTKFKIHKVNNISELWSIINSRYSKNSSYVDLSDVDVSKINDFSNLFRDFSDIEELDITSWDLSNATQTNLMFHNLRKLHTIHGIETLNVSSINEFNAMFEFCQTLKRLDISKWNIKRTATITSMFFHCYNLEEIIGIENLPKIDSQIGDQGDDIFFGCTKLKNIPSWYKGRIKFI